MTPVTIQQTLDGIRKRSAELWRIHELPPVNLETGVPKPFVVVSQSDEDVRFLLHQLDAAYAEIARLEELFDEQEIDAEGVEEE